MQHQQPASLPQPDNESARQSVRVAEHIGARITAAGGDISFAEFMHEALYAPGLGYYAAGSQKFGEAGDFITAPEVSPVFGRIVARQAAEIMAQLSQPEILEFGAGTGKLAVDLLTHLEALNSLPPHYSILEVSPDLQERQRDYLQHKVPHLLERVRWLTSMPTRFEGVVVANEVLDALPVERFTRRGPDILQIRVALSDGNFNYCERAASDRLIAAVLDVEADLGRQLPDGYTSEIALAMPPWIADLAQCMTKGVALLFDYGVSRREYYADDRSTGWLRCHFRHHAHSNPLIYPGIQDITAWVDFSACAAAAVANGFDILGYQAQAQFLLGGGLDSEMQNFADLPPRKQLELSAQIKTLTLPGEMGENFKCIALGRGEIEPPSALHFADRTRTL